jgi:hypothetical protein
MRLQAKTWLERHGKASHNPEYQVFSVSLPAKVREKSSQ